MATNKFKDVSPYVHINERHHHDTDWKHVKYLHNFSIDHTFNHFNHYINYHLFPIFFCCFGNYNNYYHHHHGGLFFHFFFFCSYLKGLSINQDVFGDDGVDQPPVSLGLFGLGRAGTIHLNNILANRKFELKYIVEDDDFKWKSVTKKLNLKGITFLRSSEAQTLYDDKDLEGFGDHLLTLLCL